MKKIMLIAATVMLLHSAAAAVDTLTPAQMKESRMTIERLLRVPEIYTVVSCRILASHPQYGVLLRFYCPDADGRCATVGRKGFSVFWWETLRDLLAQHYTITLTDIQMQRGDRLLHWQQKSFAGPSSYDGNPGH